MHPFIIHKLSIFANTGLYISGETNVCQQSADFTVEPKYEL